MEPLESRSLLSTATLNPGFVGPLPLAVTMPSAVPAVPHLVQSLNLASADAINVDQLWPGAPLGLSLLGTGITVGVWDESRVRGSHVELAGRVSYGDSASGFNEHATHVAGTIAATGLDASARGMANQAQIISYDWNNDLAELTASPSSVVVSNHSYAYTRGWAVLSDSTSPTGRSDYWYDLWSASATEDSGFGQYAFETSALDQVIAERPDLLSVWAAGNERGNNYGNARGDGKYRTFLSPSDTSTTLVAASSYAPPPKDGGASGFDTLSQLQTAKNTLVVGAVQGSTADPINPANISLASFSSFGPTDDGRIKPDVVADGVNVYSLGASNDSHYTTKNGTSMAAPSVAGAAALLSEQYQEIFYAQPTAATTKGLILHTATDLGNPGPDYTTGWGLVDAARAATFLTDYQQANRPVDLIESTYLGSEQAFPYWTAGNDPLKVTIVWTDPAGSAQAGGDDNTPVLVHDLDIRVVGPDGTHYPWTLDPSNPTQNAVRTTANHLDNVEQILIDAPTAGNYTLYVGHTGTVGQQAFTILVSGAYSAGNDYIVDNSNGAPAYVEVGPWSSGGLAGGYLGNYQFTASGGTGQDTATWTQTVSAGRYEILTTYVSGNSRASNATYRVFGNGVFKGIGSVDQRVAPNDLQSADGQMWERLGIFDLPDGNLAVQLSDQADNLHVIADAVWIRKLRDPLQPPGIQIVDDGDTGWSSSGFWGLSGAGGYNGDSRFSLASNATNVATWTFSVTPGQRYKVSTTWPAASNRSTTARFDILSENVTIGGGTVNQTQSPDDFNENGAAWENLGTEVIATSSSLVVRLASRPDGYTGADAVRIEELPSPIQIVDDGDSGWSSTGYWGTSTLPAYSGDSRFAPAGATNSTASWTFSVTPGKNYRVSATWPHHSNRSATSRFDILSGAEALLGGAVVNQQNPPGGFSESSTLWEDLATSVVAPDGTLIVRLTGRPDGAVSADAIRIEEVVAPPPSSLIVDDGDSGWSSTGSWSTSGLGGHAGDSRFSNASAGTSTSTWTFVVTPGQRYKVATTWPAATNRSATATFQVLTGGGAVVGGRTINQQQAPDDFADQGSWWEELGTSILATDSTLMVRVASRPDGAVGADAVRLELDDSPPPTAQYVDDGDVGWAATGSWASSALLGYGADSRFANASAGASVATWTFNVTPGTAYQLWTTWPNHANRSPTARFDILDGGAAIGGATINQRIAADDLSDAGFLWEQLGGSVVPTGSTLVVRLASRPDGPVGADAVRLAPTGGGSSSTGRGLASMALAGGTPSGLGSGWWALSGRSNALRQMAAALASYAMNEEAAAMSGSPIADDDRQSARRGGDDELALDNATA